MPQVKLLFPELIHSSMDAFLKRHCRPIRTAGIPLPDRIQKRTVTELTPRYFATCSIEIHWSLTSAICTNPPYSPNSFSALHRTCTRIPLLQYHTDIYFSLLNFLHYFVIVFIQKIDFLYILVQIRTFWASISGMFIFSLSFTGSIVFYARFFLFPHQLNLFPIWLYLIHLLVDFSNRSASFHGNAKALRNHLFILLNKETLLLYYSSNCMGL